MQRLLIGCASPGPPPTAMAAGPPPGAADAPRLPPRPAGQRRRAVVGRAAVGAPWSCWSSPTWTRLGTRINFIRASPKIKAWPVTLTVPIASIYPGVEWLNHMFPLGPDLEVLIIMKWLNSSKVRGRKENRRIRALDIQMAAAGELLLFILFVVISGLRQKGGINCPWTVRTTGREKKEEDGSIYPLCLADGESSGGTLLGAVLLTIMCTLLSYGHQNWTLQSFTEQQQNTHVLQVFKPGSSVLGLLIPKYFFGVILVA
ncbi:uncharacterized protein LOC143681186 isoform X2 [Tamandua tetradactyla]|uniref:uncharacterized protein LOC143681186 isoform X2 n=1 Tax=Tamandua tetradactyla TaxID=48850 RepID=UPI004053CFBA